MRRPDAGLEKKSHSQVCVTQIKEMRASTTGRIKFSRHSYPKKRSARKPEAHEDGRFLSHGGFLNYDRHLFSKQPPFDFVNTSKPTEVLVASEGV